MMRWRFESSPDCINSEYHNTVKILCMTCQGTDIRKGICKNCGSSAIAKDTCLDCRVNIVAIEDFYIPLVRMLHG